MSQKPTVSVIITTFNRAVLLEQTLQSVIKQTYRDFEVLLVDDGSSDATAEVASKYKPLVKYIYQTNKGQSPARNAGIKAARGEFVAFVDDDDLWLPEKLEYQMKTMKELSGNALIYCDTEMFDNDSGSTLYRFSTRRRPYSGSVAAKLYLGCFVSSPTPLVRRSIFDEVGFFSESKVTRLHEDWDMWLRISSKVPFVYIDKVLARYRLHKTNMLTCASADEFHTCGMAIISRAADFAPQIFGPVRRRAESNQFVRTGNAYLARKNLAAARAMYLKAIQMNRSNMAAYRNCCASLLGTVSFNLLGWATGLHSLRQ